MSPAEMDHFDMADRFEELEETANDLAKASGSEQIRMLEESLKDLKYTDVSGNPYHMVKRVLDLIVSVLLLALLLIPLLLIALAICADDPGSAVFSQYRVGKGGKRFRIYKFRTMRMDAPRYISTADLEDSSKWITRFGRILRRSSLDEALQLFNVIKGDMSLVGPRPLIQGEEEIHEMRIRFGVYQLRPGITGLAQVMGRDNVGPAEKVRWDVKYLQRFGFRQDARIVLSTVFKVLRREDIVEGSRVKKEQAL